MRPTLIALLALLTACPTPSSFTPCTKDTDCGNNEICAPVDAGRACKVIDSAAGCNTSGFLCFDRSAALECRTGMWTQLPCRGDGGCLNSMGSVTCDMNGALEGDACASSAEGRGLCTDGGTLECRDGHFVKTNSCRACTVQNDLVICTP